MSEPVTTNPIVIMLINMTVVFIVLIVLSFMIRLIHAVDPTGHEKKKPTKKAASPVSLGAPSEEHLIPVAPAGIPAEVIAAIAAAVTACGFSAHSIRVIRPVPRQGWREAGRLQNLNH